MALNHIVVGPPGVVDCEAVTPFVPAITKLIPAEMPVLPAVLPVSLTPKAICCPALSHTVLGPPGVVDCEAVTPFVPAITNVIPLLAPVLPAVVPILLTPKALTIGCVDRVVTINLILP